MLTSALYAPFIAMSWSCVPSSTSLPALSTRMRSALRTVDSLRGERRGGGGEEESSEKLVGIKRSVYRDLEHSSRIRYYSRVEARGRHKRRDSCFHQIHSGTLTQCYLSFSLFVLPVCYDQGGPPSCSLSQLVNC